MHKITPLNKKNNIEIQFGRVKISYLIPKSDNFI